MPRQDGVRPPSAPPLDGQEAREQRWRRSQVHLREVFTVLPRVAHDDVLDFEGFRGLQVLTRVHEAERPGVVVHRADVEKAADHDAPEKLGARAVLPCPVLRVLCEQVG